MGGGEGQAEGTELEGWLRWLNIFFRAVEFNIGWDGKVRAKRAWVCHRFYHYLGLSS